MRLILSFILVGITVLHHVQSARILALLPHFGKSHQMVFEPLFKKLAERGHQVTVASFFPLKNPPANYTDISFEGIANLGLEMLDMGMYENPKLAYKIPLIGDIIKQIDEITPIANWASSICEKLVAWPPLINVLKKDYDLVIVEHFNSDCMLGLLHVYNVRASVIALSSSNILPWSSGRLGFVDNPSYIPVLTSPWTAKMTYLERIKNTFLNVYLKFMFWYISQEHERAIIEKHYGMDVPLVELSRNISLLMVNTFHALNGVRPSIPGLIEVGGMHLDNTKKGVPKVSLTNKTKTNQASSTFNTPAIKR